MFINFFFVIIFLVFCKTVAISHCPGTETFQLYPLGYFRQRSINITSIESLENCLNICRRWYRCQGAQYNGSQCWLFDDHRWPEQSAGHRDDARWIYAEKICLHRAEHCQQRPWTFELVPANRDGHPSGVQQQKRLRTESLAQCRQWCLDERSFPCRSAMFDEIGGWCTMADLNRYHIGSNETHGRYYIENKCINGHNRLWLGNEAIRSGSQSECRDRCLANDRCRSFEYNPGTGDCRWSHLVGPTARRSGNGDDETVIFEISTCYNVSIACQSKAMRIQIKTNKLFHGKIYAQSQPNRCVNDVRGRFEFELVVPYVNNNNASGQKRCDTRQPIPGRFANDVVIQHHDLVLTTNDLALGVFCKFDLVNNSVARVDLKIQGEITTEKLKGTAKLPQLSLHIVDQNGADIEEVSVGDILRVQIRMNGSQDTYGIFARNLIARDQNNPGNSLTLIDARGCPVEMRMMREIRLINETVKSLESFLEAFTFTGGSILSIEVEVETCLERCHPVQCQIPAGRSIGSEAIVTSYGRRRRRRSADDSDRPGEIVSMTMLSKSVMITGSPPAPEIRQQRSSGRILEPSSPSSFMRISVRDKNLVCFEPWTIMVVAAVACCIQTAVFSLIFCIAIKMQRFREPVPPGNVAIKNSICRRHHG